MEALEHKACITGVGQSDVGRRLERDPLELTLDACIAAIEDAGPRLFQGDYETEWEAQALRARAFLQLGEVDSALAVGRRAVSTVERVRGSFRSRAMRSGFAAARHKTYADLVAGLLQAGMTPEAFAVADRIVVMHAGEVRGEIEDARTATQEQILGMVVGAAA